MARIGRASEEARVRERLATVLQAAKGTAEPPPAAPVGGFPPAAAFDPGRRGVRALAIVAVLVLVAAAAVAWLARPRPEPLARPPAAASADEGAAASSSAVVVVAVMGRVRRPGLVRLPVGARVADAIEAAGGVPPEVDLSLVNLARKVTDGELILIGIGPPEGGTAGGAGNAGGKLNLNTATLAQLDALPGVGPVLAQRILDFRERHGRFRSVAELREVEGIGDAKYEQLKDLVTT